VLVTDTVVYYGSRSTIASIKELSGINNIFFKKIALMEGNSKICTGIRLLQSAINNIILLLIADRKAVIIYNYNNMLSLSFVNAFNKVLKKNIAIICHGEFEAFNEKFPVNKKSFWNIYFRSLKNWFSSANCEINNIVFIVLGENILMNIKLFLPEKTFRRFIFIEHPYILMENKKKEKARHPSHFGMIGQARIGKKIEAYIELAKEFETEVRNEKIVFYIIGSVNKKNEIIQKSGIKTFEKNLDRKEFNMRIGELDYVLFFYDEDSYRFTASGAYFDALVLEKPYISLRNNYFEYMANKYGATGLLVDSVKEMADVIKKIIEGNMVLQYDFDAIKQSMAPKQIARQLKAGLEIAGMA
jgi:hypothetical protein